MMMQDALTVDIDGMAGFLAEQPDVVAAYLYGSVARGQANALSDVDVAVLLQPGLDNESAVERQLELAVALSRFSNREVQVMLLNNAPPQLAYEAIREGRLLCERDRLVRIRFEVRTMKLYFDLQPALDAYDRTLAKRIQEVGLGARRKTHPDAIGAAKRIQRRLEKLSRR